MRICVLGSGSSGNCTYLSAGDTQLLIDFGFSARRTQQLLQSVGSELEQISGILITHEHIDHVKGLPTLLKYFSIPLYITRPTAEQLNLNGADLDQRFFESDTVFELGSMEIRPFSVSHDAADPCGFVIRHHGFQVTHVTDLGCVTTLVRQSVLGSHCLVMESNHDEEMLKIGPYPWPLKQRVMSRLGHLSNRELACFLENDFDGVARHLVLAHLSRNNNHPEIARMTSQEAISRRFSTSHQEIQIVLSNQDHPTPLIEVG